MTLRDFFCFLGLHSRFIGVKLDKYNQQKQVPICPHCGKELN